jgi:hypothetical protein
MREVVGLAFTSTALGSSPSKKSISAYPRSHNTSTAFFAASQILSSAGRPVEHLAALIAHAFPFELDELPVMVGQESFTANDGDFM